MYILQFMECDWDEPASWKPSDELMECEGSRHVPTVEKIHLTKQYLCVVYGCANPPVPNATRHLKISNYTEGQVLDFGQTVGYVCEDGNLFIEEGKSL